MSPRDPHAHLRPDPDFERARRALGLGWVTREQIERAILREEEQSGSGLLSFLPLSPEQISTLDDDLVTPPPNLPDRLGRRKEPTDEKPGLDGNPGADRPS